MTNDLKLLIDHYEAEQKLLQSLLDECLLEEDYKYARLYLKSLHYMQQTLYNLKCLSDYNYAEKSEALRILSNIKFNIKKDKSDNKLLKQLQERHLNEFNEKFLKLNELPIDEVEEKYDVENATIRLLEQEINGFKIFIQKKFNLYLDFTLIEVDVIHIEFTHFNKIFNQRSLEQHEFNYLINDTEIEALKRIGFKLNEDQNIFYINFDLANQSIQSLKIFLARLFFEILHWHSRKDFELEIY